MYYFIDNGKEIKYTPETELLFDSSRHVLHYRDEGVSDEVIELNKRLLCEECTMYCGCKVCEKFRPTYDSSDEDTDIWIV